MATVTVKNIPDELYEKLKADAEINRRSINSQIIVCIENAIGTRLIDVTKTLEHARRLRRLTEESPVDGDAFNQAKADGRL